MEDVEKISSTYTERTKQAPEVLLPLLAGLRYTSMIYRVGSDRTDPLAERISSLASRRHLQAECAAYRTLLAARKREYRHAAAELISSCAGRESGRGPSI